MDWVTIGPNSINMSNVDMIVDNPGSDTLDLLFASGRTIIIRKEDAKKLRKYLKLNLPEVK